MTKDLKEASGGGNREDCFKGGRCPELNNVVRSNANNCGKMGCIRPNLLRGHNQIKTKKLLL